MEEPDEVIHYLQVRTPTQIGWTTVAAGTADEIEIELRSWHESEALNDPPSGREARVCRTERFYGPVIRLGATIRAAGEQGELRETPPSKPT